MSVKAIGSQAELLRNLTGDKKNYVLIYKKGSEASDCSFQGVEAAAEELSDVNVYSVDVNRVQDVHTTYGVTSAPTLLVFQGNEFVKTVKGCNDEGFYKSLFESSLFSAGGSREEKSQKRVTVYSTPTCSWCTTLKRHLDQHGVRYREVDVSKDEKAANDMVRKSGQQGVPQTDINGQMIVGFDKNRIDGLLGIGGR